MDTLSEKARVLLGRPILATLATLDPAGRPHLTPLWVDVEDDAVVVNTAQGRAKERHVRADPRVGLTVIDPDDPYNVVALRGTVTEVTTEGADEMIDRLSEMYMGRPYPNRQPGEVRVTIRITPERAS